MQEGCQKLESRHQGVSSGTDIDIGPERYHPEITFSYKGDMTE